MNDYIINPWFFYWLDVVPVIIKWSTVLGGLGAVSCFIAFIFFAISKDKDSGLDTKEIACCAVVSRHIFKISVPLFIIGMTLSAFIPSRQAMIQMAVASKATYSNVEKIKTTAKEFVDYVIDKSKELSNGKEK